jgi:tetratricopeptide (TPR) repeat protein
MESDQILNEALRLDEAGHYAEALKLWEQLCDLPALDVESHCVYLLNERKCRSALGQHEIALQLLDRVESMDTSRQFHLYVEHARINMLYDQNKFAEGNERSRKFLKENTKQLTRPDFAFLVYEQKLGLARGLIHTNEFDEGLQMLTGLLSVTEERDKREIHYYRGYAYRQLKQYDSAIDEFNHVLSASNQDSWAAAAHWFLAELYTNKQAFAWAKQHLQNAENLKDFFTFPLSHVYISLANVCFRLNEPEESRRYKKLAESEPAAPDAKWWPRKMR